MPIRSRPLGRRPLTTSDSHSLGVFRDIVDCDGISSAAEKLNLDVSTISRQLKELEIRLGMRLCDRGRGGFALTSEGEAVYRLSCDLLRTIEDFEDRIDEVRNCVVGQLRIGAVNHVLTNPEISLERVIRRVHRNAPELDVAYEIMPSREICRALIDGRIHLGITAHDRDHAELSRFSIYVEKHRLYCGRGHPLYEEAGTPTNAADLKGLKYVAREHRANTDIVAESFGLTRGAVANDIEAITLLVQSGIYLGYLPTHHVAALPDGKKLRPLDIDQADCEVPLYLYYRREAKRLNSVRMFLGELESIRS